MEHLQCKRPRRPRHTWAEAVRTSGLLLLRIACEAVAGAVEEVGFGLYQLLAQHGKSPVETLTTVHKGNRE